MSRLAMLFAAMMLSPSVAIAATARGEYPACREESQLEELAAAGAAKDMTAVMYLMEKECLMLAKGTRVEIAGSTWTGKVKIKAYGKNGRGYDLWTRIDEVDTGH